MRILFATAELAPFVKVGGLADASAGLVRALRHGGIELEVVLPDYGGLPFKEDSEESLVVPSWAEPVSVARGSLDGFGSVALVRSPTIIRSHPYIDEDGYGWPDNDHRFFVFSASVAALADKDKPDVVHLNDWHTAAALGFLASKRPSVLTIHNLAYQGNAAGGWLDNIPHRSEAFEWWGGTNPLTGGIALADKVVTVSPNFAREVLVPETGFGVHEALGAKGRDFVGILNGIDTEIWDPANDPHLAAPFDIESIGSKRRNVNALAAELGWEPSNQPMIGMVTRLTDQKGVDIALDAARALPDLGARMILLGSGERYLADAAKKMAVRMPERFAFRSGYDEGLSHRIFGGSDLYLMPSRFEPGGLTQMQAMRYGSIPVVTDVGGLHDTVVDADAHPETGNGFVAPEATPAAVGDALGRAVRAWRSTRRRGELRRRGMSHDWSWTGPAARYADLYAEVTSAR